VKARAAVIAGLVLVAGGFLWCRPGGEAFELPEGFTGPVVVFFSHPRGTSPGGRFGTQIYRIPASGVLLLKTDPPSGIQLQSWSYVGRDGKRTPIASEDDTRPDFSVAEPRVRMTSMNAQDGTFHWIQAQIGRPNDISSFGTPPHFLVDPIIEELEAGKR
jgi:hypothetical protein